MILHFTIKYSTLPGEFILVRLPGKKAAGKVAEFRLEYSDSNYWKGNITATNAGDGKIRYEIVLKNETELSTGYVLCGGKVKLKKRLNNVDIVHENAGEANFIRLNDSKPFFKTFRQKNIKKAKRKPTKAPTHIFKTNIPRLQDYIFLCITGSAKKTGSFNPAKPVLFARKRNGESRVKLNLSKENFPVEYKLAFYDASQKKIISYETGPNRILQISPGKINWK